MKKLGWLLLAGMIMMMLTGCDRLEPVRAYQQKATSDCEKNHTPEQCKALSYPACGPDGHSDCHN
jgi:hypothetical protein